MSKQNNIYLLNYLKEDQENVQLLQTPFILNNINAYNINNIDKITLNFSFESIKFDKKRIIHYLILMELISGKKPTLTVAKKPIMGLNLKKGNFVGCKVTLRNQDIIHFLENLKDAFANQESKGDLSYNSNLDSNKNEISMVIHNLNLFTDASVEVTSFTKDLEISVILTNSNFYTKDLVLRYLGI